MTCAEGVRTRLLAITALTAIVGARIWTLRFAQGATLPAVCVQHISDVPVTQLRGTSGLKRARIQIDVLAEQTTAGSGIKHARAVDAEILGDYSGGSATGLEGFAGTVSGSFVIHFAVPIGYREEYLGDELKQARVSRDWMIHYEA